MTVDISIVGEDVGSSDIGGVIVSANDITNRIDNRWGGASVVSFLGDSNSSIGIGSGDECNSDR